MSDLSEPVSNKPGSGKLGGGMPARGDVSATDAKSVAESEPTSRPRPLPDHEFPVWLMRTTVQRLREWSGAILVGPLYKLLARFSGDMRTCARSSLDLIEALRLCLKPHATTRLGQLWRTAPEQIRNGASLTESLRSGERLLPAFYLPIVEAGETSGRLEEAFHFLERHCKLLARPAAALRNVWLFPLCILVVGAIVKIGLTLAMGSLSEALGLLVSEVGSLLQLVLLVAVVALTPLRRVFDQVRLTLPWLGELEREIAVNRFFRVMSLMYGVADIRVEAMIRTAAQTVTNREAQSDLLKAATAIANKTTVGEAFRRVTILSIDEKGTIDAGELSGTLEQSFDYLAQRAEESMMAKLAFLQPLLTRIVMAAVAFSIVTTLFRLIIH